MSTEQQEQQKQMMRNQWSHSARTWAEMHDAFSAASKDVTLAIVQAGGLGPGMHVLDLAGGPGEPALTAAKCVEPGGSVTCTDLTQEMVDAASANARKLGLTNMSFRQADMENIPFANESFDRVTCRFGIMFCPDPIRALTEIHRVLKPRGRAAFTVWAPQSENPMFAVAGNVLAAHGLVQPPPPNALTPFTFAEPGSLSAKLREVGYSDVSEDPLELTWAWPTPPDGHIEFMKATQPATKDALEAAPEAVLAEIRAAMGEYYDGTHINYPAKIYVASGVK